MLIEEVLREYVAVRLFDSSPHSVYIHEIGIRHFSEFLGKPARTGHLTDAQVGAWVRWLIDKKKLARASVRMYRNRMCALWRFAARKNWTAVWPELPAIKPTHRIPTALTMPQLLSLYQATQKLTGHIGGIPQGPWFRAFISFAWSSGERRAAMLSLRRIDVHLGTATAVVRGENRKGSPGDRMYYLSPECVKDFSDIWEPSRELVLPFPYCHQTFYARLRILLDMAGLPVTRDYMTHVFRRSVASHLKLAGGDASAALGHGDSKVTTDSYIDPRICPAEMPWKKLPPLNFGTDDPPRVA